MCNAFSQTVAPNLTVAGLIKVAYSFEDFETYITKRGFIHERTDSSYQHIDKDYRYKPKTPKADDLRSALHLTIYSDAGDRISSTIGYSPHQFAEFRKLVDEIRILGFQYVSWGIHNGDTAKVYTRDRTKVVLSRSNKTNARKYGNFYWVSIFLPTQPRVVSEEKVKPKRCSDEGSYDKGYTWAGNQKGLLADCDYLFDIAQASDSGPLSRYCFCQGVEAYRKQNR